ncbi:glycosyltransferase family 2 protein [Nereida sp. MMG025]|uniref:glycosyltransferase family 2 protein n=1 Tax=Nereida sp. MMG025 TaxID=2909981 RepID=UPI001F3CB522|nr:glycosyltransferase family 2 protein [Nereida sp. MMG025]MCF6445476.1 glycosyltransferase family 2 protein [Nereida sp. MMG025]
MHILAITCVKNEGPYLLDWLAHARALGVSEFLVFSNDCDDGTDILLDEIAKDGWLTHVRHVRTGDKTIQFQALKAARKQAAYERADWIMFIDVDEYICLAPPLNALPDLIAACGAAEAITLPWRLFGNADQHHASDAAVTTRFTCAASRAIPLPLAHFFKTLFKRTAFREAGVHRPKPLKDHIARWADAGGAPLPDSFATQANRINLFGHLPEEPLVQLNHYSLRSTEEFVLKTQRGLPNKTDIPIDISYWAARNWNTVEDDLITRHTPDRSWISDAMLARHAKSVKHHRATFDALMQRPEMIQFFWRLQLAGGSYEPTLPMTKAHLSRLRSAPKS